MRENNGYTCTSVCVPYLWMCSFVLIRMISYLLLEGGKRFNIHSRPLRP